MFIGSKVDTQVTHEVVREAGRQREDNVFLVRPTVSVAGRSGRWSASLAYSAELAEHSDEVNDRGVRSRLAAAFSMAPFERWLYLDVTATVADQTVSAFGAQAAADSSAGRGNVTEVGTLTVTPAFRTVVGSAVTLDARFIGQFVNGRRSIAADSSTRTVQVSAASVERRTLLNWGLVASSQLVDYRAGRETRLDRTQASLAFSPDVDWTLQARAGQERTDVADTIARSYDNWGLGLTWRPSPRTRAQMEVDERYFGRAHRVLVEHRLPLSSIRLASTRDAGSASGSSSATTTLFKFLDAQLASDVPDAVEREQRVLQQLAAANLDPNARVSVGFISTAINVREVHTLSMAHAQRRWSVSAQWVSSSSRSIDALSDATAREAVRQQGVDLSLAYRPTPTSSMSLAASQLRTRSTATRAGGELLTAGVSMSGSVSKDATAGLAVRLGQFRGARDPYEEATVTATLGLRF